MSFTPSPSVLKTLADREVGDTGVDLDFFGEYCRFAVVIVGKSRKLLREDIKPYVGFIEGTLIPAGVETIYLLAPARNAPYVRQIAAAVGRLINTSKPSSGCRSDLRAGRSRRLTTICSSSVPGGP